MGNIICQTCKEEKAISDIRCKGSAAHPALCVVCFRKKKSAYMKEYYRRPEVNKARKEYVKAYGQIPTVNKRNRAYAKEYRKTAEAKEGRVKWINEYVERPGVRDVRRGYARKSYHKPECKERKRVYEKNYYNRPDVKERIRLNGQKPEAKERMRNINFRDTYNARDRYIKLLIRQRSGCILSSKDIPPELIETQRQSLILKRTIKQKQRENEQHSTTKI